MVARVAGRVEDKGGERRRKGGRATLAVALGEGWHGKRVYTQTPTK